MPTFSPLFLMSVTNNEIKEYNRDNEKLILEGEYLNGKKNGKIKEYEKDGNLILEGEYLNDEKNGFFKEYDRYYDHSLIFEGEYLIFKIIT